MKRTYLNNTYAVLLLLGFIFSSGMFHSTVSGQSGPPNIVVEICDSPYYEKASVRVVQQVESVSDTLILFSFVLGDLKPGLHWVFVRNHQGYRNPIGYPIFIHPSVLPVELLNFNIDKKNGRVILKWTTLTEKDFYGFEIQRAFSSPTSFRKIAFIKAQGTKNTKTEYSYFDYPNNSGKYYYRLKLVNLDGSFTFSDTLNTVWDIPREFILYSVYPNPSSGFIRIAFYLPEDEIVDVWVYNVLGRFVQRIQSQKFPAGFNEIKWEGRKADGTWLANGTYLIILRTRYGTKTTKVTFLR